MISQAVAKNRFNRNTSCKFCKSWFFSVKWLCPNLLNLLTLDTSVQSLFFEQIRKRLSPHVSFVDELAELLDISRDSAYRRMRGETVLSLDEVKKLSVRFKISVDSIIS